MYKILTVVGTRPHFVKAAMVSKAIAEHDKLFEVMIHTGQHYDKELSDTFFNDLVLPTPDYRLEIGSGRAAWQVGKMITAIDEVLEQEQPHLIIVYGDTNTTAAGAIAAAKNNIPLAHVEAGLREFNKQIPEEINKLLTDAVTDLFFCPTPTGAKNLVLAGIKEEVHIVGDVGIDLIKANIDRIAQRKSILSRYKLTAKNYFLLTCHRAANTSSKHPLYQILDACVQLNLPVVFPVHPRTLEAITTFGLSDFLNTTNIIPLPPQGFWDLQALLYHSKMAITDSGGIIKESYFHKVPAVIVDQQTEWVETVSEGWNQITGPNTAKILEAIHNYRVPELHTSVLGDGRAALNTIKIIYSYLENSNNKC